MRIEGFQNIPDLLSAHAPGRSGLPATPAGARGDSVSLSSFAETLRSVQRHRAGEAGGRADRVDALVQAARDGGLAVDLDRLAERIVDLHLIDLRE